MNHVVRVCGIVLILLLVSGGTASAWPSHARSSGLALLAVRSEVNTLSFSVLVHRLELLWGSGDGDDDDHDKDRDKDHDKDHHHGRHAPKPTPEPSTIASFGAALLICGGVFYSRRLRKNR